MTTYTDCTPLTSGTIINALNTWVRAFQAGLGTNGLGSVSDAKHPNINDTLKRVKRQKLMFSYRRRY